MRVTRVRFSIWYTRTLRLAFLPISSRESNSSNFDATVNDNDKQTNEPKGDQPFTIRRSQNDRRCCIRRSDGTHALILNYGRSWKKCLTVGQGLLGRLNRRSGTSPRDNRNERQIFIAVVFQLVATGG